MSQPPNQPPYGQPSQQPPQGQPYGQPPQGVPPQQLPQGQPYGYPQQPPPGYGYQPQPQVQGQPYGFQQQFPANNYPTPITKPTNPLFGIGAAGGLLLIICAFLPWASAFGISVNGLGAVSGSRFSSTSGSGDGVFSIVLGIAIVVVMGLGFLRGGKGLAIGGLVVSGLAILLMLFEVLNIGGSRLDIGFGVWVGLLGAIMGAVGGFLALNAKPNSAP